MTHPLTALIAGVERLDAYGMPIDQTEEDLPPTLVRLADVLAALEAAPVPDLTDSVTVHANMLRGTIAKPTVAQIIHLYGREAFQPMIDAAVAKALDDACLAVSEHADWPEDEHGRTEQVGLFARVINAIRAIAPAQVNETPKSEHDSADVLTAAPVPGEYTLAPHLQKIVEDAKTVPQWDTEKDRLTVPAQPDLGEAAAMVLGAMNDGEVWGRAVNAAMPIINADLDQSAWVTVSEVREALVAALRAMIDEARDD